MENKHDEETKDVQVEGMTVLCEQVDGTTTRGEDPVKMSHNASSTDDDNKQLQAEMHTPAEVTDAPQKGTAGQGRQFECPYPTEPLGKEKPPDT